MSNREQQPARHLPIFEGIVRRQDLPGSLNFDTKSTKSLVLFSSWKYVLKLVTKKKKFPLCLTVLLNSNDQPVMATLTLEGACATIYVIMLDHIQWQVLHRLYRYLWHIRNMEAATADLYFEILVVSLTY